MIHGLNGFQLTNLPLNITNTTHCPDNEIGEIVYNGTRFTNPNGGTVFGLQTKSNANNSLQQRVVLNYANLKSFSNPVIVILIESPHTDEFSPIGNPPIYGPAVSNSGTNFNNQCINVFNNNRTAIVNALQINNHNNQNQKYSICFVNAIQYQCSLGIKPLQKDLRDYVFMALWNTHPNSFRDDLVERLNLLKPCLIINACTKNLKNLCCNATNIVSGLQGFSYSFLTASEHICKWDNNTIIL